jgi:hypothetical protein
VTIYYVDCQYCGRQFQAKHTNAKYCSGAHRVAALRKRREEVDLGARYAEAVTRERELTEADQEVLKELLERPADTPVRKRYVRRRELSPQPEDNPVEKWRRKPTPEQAQGMAKLARKVVLPEDPYEDWGDGPVIGAEPDSRYQWDEFRRS